MVDLNQKYNLNHIYVMDSITNSVIAIGANVSTNIGVLTLFEKSLALASDLKRLPILRGVSMSFEIAAPCLTNMAASGLGGVMFRFRVYNGDVDPENLIWQQSGHIHYIGAGGATITRDNDSWDYEGGILLSDTLNAELVIYTGANVAGTAFPIAQISVQSFYEIDWVPITKEQLSEYIQEHIYAKM